MADPSSSGSHPPQRLPLVVPECGTGPLCVSLWLVQPGAMVRGGERVVELLAGGATIDLDAPADGRLVAQLVDEDDRVTPGQTIAEIEVMP